MEEKKTQGNCIISDEVIATIAGAAAREVPGVIEMANRPADFKSLVSTGAERFVAVTNRESTIMLDVYVQIAEGIRIPDVASAIQENVKAAVQAMTNKPVTRVNVHIAGIVLGDTAAQ